MPNMESGCRIWKVGAKYGMTKVHKPDGERIKAKDSMEYLGTMLRNDVLIASELGRRLGMAWGEFSKLERLWKHTSLPVRRKLHIF